jgi:hypothetical protein
MGTIVNLYQYGMILPLIIVMDIMILLFTAANLVPIIRTHRLQKRSALPPPNTTKETFYYIEDQQHYSTPQQPEPYQNQLYDQPPAPAASAFKIPRRQVSQAVSKADTQARWSGVSGSETMTGVPGARETVPPYHAGGMRSPRMSTAKESLSETGSI